jgi:hypothetical protein
MMYLPGNLIAVVMIVAALGIGRAQAAEYAPRVVSPHHADIYRMKTFAQFPRWRELKGVWAS